MNQAVNALRMAQMGATRPQQKPSPIAQKPVGNPAIGYNDMAQKPPMQAKPVASAGNSPWQKPPSNNSELPYWYRRNTGQGNFNQAPGGGFSYQNQQGSAPSVMLPAYQQPTQQGYGQSYQNYQQGAQDFQNQIAQMSQSYGRGLGAGSRPALQALRGAASQGGLGAMRSGTQYGFQGQAMPMDQFGGAANDQARQFSRGPGLDYGRMGQQMSDLRSYLSQQNANRDSAGNPIDPNYGAMLQQYNQLGNQMRGNPQAPDGYSRQFSGMLGGQQTGPYGGMAQGSMPSLGGLGPNARRVLGGITGFALGGPIGGAFGGYLAGRMGNDAGGIRNTPRADLNRLQEALGGPNAGFGRYRGGAGNVIGAIGPGGLGSMVDTPSDNLPTVPYPNFMR